MGSIGELETQLLIAVDSGYLHKESPVFEILERVPRSVGGLHEGTRT